MLSQTHSSEMMSSVLLPQSLQSSLDVGGYMKLCLAGEREGEENLTGHFLLGHSIRTPSIRTPSIRTGTLPSLV